VGVAWKLRQGLNSRLEETKKGTVFGIISQLKKLSKSNDVHAQNKTFLGVRNELLLPLKFRVMEGGVITFIDWWVVTCIKIYFIVHGVYTIRGPSIGCSCHFLLIEVQQSIYSSNAKWSML
jgi:hypothetical protein